MLDCVIVGGGFTGSAVACHLLEQLPAGARLRLVNAGAPLARGLAYGTQSAHHLLNVPAARMAWRSDRPYDFIQWLTEQGRAAAGKSFVPRAWYGEYLGARLQDAVNQRPDVRWEHVVGSIRDVRPVTGGWSLTDANGVTAQTRQLVLALGHFAPQDPHPDLPGLPPPLYIRDPWQRGALDGLDPDAPVAILGAGLTMLDLLISLNHAGHRGPVLCLSRRGVAPLPHRDNELPPPGFRAPAAWLTGHALRQWVRELRDAARALNPGEDWRDLWVAMRARTPALWQSLDARDRRRFLRHLQVYWDVHRHRAAPPAIATMQALRESGRLKLHAGRVLHVDQMTDGLQLQWRERGQEQIHLSRVLRLFNCTGPSSRIGQDQSGLFPALAAEGRLAVCPHGLGVLTGADYQLLDVLGQPQAGLHYIGPLLRAQHWEATAVPELREHAQRLAGLLAHPASSHPGPGILSPS